MTPFWSILNADDVLTIYTVETEVTKQKVNKLIK